jgi:hypothetical protein
MEDSFIISIEYVCVFPASYTGELPDLEQLVRHIIDEQITNGYQMDLI